MTTLASLLQEGATLLAEAGISEASLDAWLLLEFIAGCNRAYYYAHPQEEVPKEKAQAYRKLVKRRAGHIPLQHLTHQAFFMGYEFYVDENVLIPRQDTEVLAETAISVAEGMERPRLLDMCTGSGCILLSLLLEIKGSTGVGADVSGQALQVARHNAGSLGVGERAVFVESDLFSASFFQKQEGKEPPGYDILVSNPPYIRTAEIGNLMDEVRLFDPRLALDGREDGLYFYRRITREGKAYLRPGAWLLYEIGCDQGEEVAGIMEKEGYSDIEIKKDLAGLDRVVLGHI